MQPFKRRPTPTVRFATVLSLVLSQLSCTSQPSGELRQGISLAPFHIADGDGDGFLSWPEIDSAYRPALDKAEWSALDLFAQFDKNGDDHLNRSEHRLFVQRLTAQLRAMATEENTHGHQRFRALDLDHNEVLDENELEETPLAEDLRYRLFDDNNDGVLDREEYQEYVASRQAAELN